LKNGIFHGLFNGVLGYGGVNGERAREAIRVLDDS